MDKHTLFVSHTHVDHEFAAALKDLIEDAFVGTLKVFVSSDPRSIPMGARWEQELWENLERASLYIIVLSPAAISKPWVIFEAGAACGRKVRMIPICIRDLQPCDVSSPLDKYQMLSIRTSEDIELLLKQIADYHDCRWKAEDDLKEKTLNLSQSKFDDMHLPLLASAKKHEPIVVGDMRSEIDELMSKRQLFFETLDRIYLEKYKGKKDYPETILALVDLAGPPRGLPVDVESGENLRDYPTKHARLLLNDSAQLLNFCKEIYPPKVSDKPLGECSLIDDSLFDEFHSARGAHAKFWNRSAERVYNHRVLSLDTLEKEFAAHSRMVNLLCYLEIALVQWTQDPGPGKVWLFKLNKDWSDDT